MLHHLFQRHHLPPEEVYRKPRGAKLFMYASTLFQIEMEEKEEQKSKTRRR